MENQQMFRIELIKRFDFTTASSVTNEYYSFGQFDFINIEPIIVEPNLKNLIKNYNDFYLNDTNKNKHTQIIYGYLDQNQSSDFFEKQCEWTYQVISIISANNEYIKEYKNKSTDDLHYIILKTLDKNNFILILRSKRISDSIEFLSQLASNNNKQFNIIYSIISIKNNFLDTSNTSKTDYAFINETISVTINFKIADINKFKEFVNNLTKCLITANITYYSHYFLGNTDYEIIIPKIDSKLFLSYHKNKAILNNESLNQCIKYMHSHISDAGENQIIETKQSNIDTTNIDTTDKQTFEQISHLKKFVLENSKDSEINAVIIKILELLNQLLSYNDNHIEIIKFILPTVYEYVIQMHNGNLDTTRRKYNALDELYGEVNNLVVNTFHTGHDPFIFPESYFSSNKLICFYLNYLQRLKSIYADESIRYEFIISPSLNTTTQVISLSKQDNNLNRLLAVHIPIIDLYDLKTSLVALTHEAGHFLPKDSLRMRQLRAKIIIRNFIILLQKEIIKGLRKEDIENSNIIELCNELTTDLSFQIDTKITTEIKTYENKELIFYLVNTEKIVRDTVDDYLSKHREKFYNLIQDNDNKPQSNNIKRLLEINIERLLHSKSIYNLDNLYLNIEKILRECYSDVFAIEVLNLNANTYFQAINNTAMQTNTNKNYDAFLSARLAIITQLYNWEKDLENNSYISINNRKLVLNAISHYNQNKNTSSNNFNYFYGLHDHSVYLKTIEYFKECKKQIGTIKKIESYTEFINNNDISLLEQLDFIDRNSNYVNYREIIEHLIKELKKLNISF